MKTMWSVHAEVNNYDYDLCNGTYAECVEYVRSEQLEGDYTIDKIRVDDDDCHLETLEMVSKEEVESEWEEEESIWGDEE